MKVLDLSFGGKPYRYLLAHSQDLPQPLQLNATPTTAAFESVASSRFFLSADDEVLAKVVPDKFDRHRHTLKWLGRDYLEKRWLFQFDARKEYRCGRALQRMGLSTPRYYGWGISLNPFNRNASLLLMEHIHDARSGGEVFEGLEQQQRFAFLDALCREIAHIAHHGYALRDLHFNNLLVADSGKLIWIDTHLRKLPPQTNQRWPAIKRSLSPHKLGGDIYHQHALHQLGVLLEAEKER